MNKIQKLIDNNLLMYNQKAIYDYKFQISMRDAPWKEWLDKPGFFECRDEYIETIHNWIISSKLNTIDGLENFPIKHMTIGTTQTFDEAYFTYADKRLRIFRGEYSYHKRVFPNVLFLDDNMELRENDWVIISLPFCGIGDEHPLMHQVLEDAWLMDVPVIIDCAWFGTCRDMKFNFNHPAITQVCFSLTKGLGVGHLRSGIRYMKEDNHSIISQQHDYNHLTLVCAQIGIHQMKNFSADFIGTKYYDAHLDVCKTFELQPTKCMHIGMADNKEPWDKFVYDEMYYKVGLRQIVKDFHNGNKHGF